MYRIQSSNSTQNICCGYAIKKKNLRADILRSINPRLSESAQMPDFTWKASFLGETLEFAKDLPLVLPWLPSVTTLVEGCDDTESDWEVKSPKTSDPSKLLSGTEAKGSKVLLFTGPEFSDLLSGCTTGSGMENKSTVGETEGMAGCEEKRSTSPCASTRSTNGILALNENVEKGWQVNP